MKFLPLILKNLFRKKIRTTLTILSIAVAMFLFGLLAAIDLAFTAALDVAGADRLVVIGRSGVIQPLLLKYRDQIARIAGVTDVTYASWFGGVYQEERNFFPQFAVEEESFFRLYPEYVVPKDQFAAFLADREGALVGVKTMNRFKWKIGDRIPIRGTIFPGSWEFNIRGVYTGRRPTDDETGFLLRAKYLEERAPRWWSGYVGWFVVRIQDASQAEAIAKRIDERFANSQAETKTQTDKAFAASWINQIGNIRLMVTAIGSVVFFTLLLVTGNTMATAVRERTGEIAVLKTVGFSGAMIVALVLAESVVVALIGGAVGLLAVKLFTLSFLTIVNAVPEMQPLAGLLPVFYLPLARMLYGVLVAIGVGLAAGAIPSTDAVRLKIVDALRRV